MVMPYERQRSSGIWAARMMDTVGDGSGSFDGTIDASVTNVDLHYAPPQGSVALINRLIIFIEDIGNFDATGYGAGPALTNGIVDGITDPDNNFVGIDIPMYAQADWAALCHDVSYQSFGTGPNFLTLRYTFTNDGSPLYIPDGHKYTIRLRDNFTNLVGHTFRIGAVECPYQP